MQTGGKAEVTNSAKRGDERPYEAKWRRGWDLNPRMAETINTLAGCPIRPLWHLSARNTNGTKRRPASAIRGQS